MQWDALERPTVERGNVWYAIVGLAALVAAVWSILTAAWTLTIVIILSGAMYFQHLKLHVLSRRIVIQKEGIAINDVCTPWEQCSGFWMYQHGEHTMLHIEKSRGWDREIATLIEGQDHREVAMLLSEFLPYQSTRRENVLDSIIRICKL
ncbi:MAG: hypothetical protein Greene101449_1057 [Candidatus Peregrinibacteria bacterium Greene1014_49]|nr:MAG: hypothetical protein Greene101449_1057 [Candidatus Peregrinibacteria bacterium Greene1014_49]